MSPLLRVQQRSFCRPGRVLGGATDAPAIPVAVHDTGRGDEAAASCPSRLKLVPECCSCRVELLLLAVAGQAVVRLEVPSALTSAEDDETRLSSFVCTLLGRARLLVADVEPELAAATAKRKLHNWATPPLSRIAVAAMSVN